MRHAYLEVQAVCKMQLAKSPAGRIIVNLQWSMRK